MTGCLRASVCAAPAHGAGGIFLRGTVPRPPAHAGGAPARDRANVPARWHKCRTSRKKFREFLCIPLDRSARLCYNGSVWGREAPPLTVRSNRRYLLCCQSPFNCIPCATTQPPICGVHCRRSGKWGTTALSLPVCTDTPPKRFGRCVRKSDFCPCRHTCRMTSWSPIRRACWDRMPPSDAAMSPFRT